MKSADTGNGVMFRSGDNVDLGPSHIGVSVIDTAMQMVSSGVQLMVFQVTESLLSAFPPNVLPKKVICATY